MREIRLSRSMSGMWNGAMVEHLKTQTKGAANAYVLHNAIAPHLDSTHLRHADCPRECPLMGGTGSDGRTVRVTRVTPNLTSSGARLFVET
jgi:hypothetical protein